MEVCGGHTHAIYKHGVEDLVPPEVDFLHGPGCPVCVIPMGRVDDAISLAERPEVTFTTFGDMLRVPGGRARCSRRKQEAPTCAWSTRRSTRSRIARRSPTARSSSSRSASRRPRRRRRSRSCAPATRGSRNFSAFCNHVTIAPPLRAILDSPGLRLDGFIAPGHVSTVIGTEVYDFIPAEYGKPVVVRRSSRSTSSQATAMVLRQLREGRCEVENQYTRVVRRDGNPRALEPRSRRRWSCATRSSGAGSAGSSGAR